MMTQHSNNDMPLPPDTQKTKILIVEDDRDLNNLLKYTLEATSEYKVVSHFDGANAFDLIAAEAPDLVLLDVMLPGIYGTEILKRVRANPLLLNTPVILLTARSQEHDKIEGFESGADDYITKPFSPKELLLRVQALLRRSSPGKVATAPLEEASKEKSIVIGPLTIFPEQYRTEVDNETVPLTSTEYQLLLYLAERLGRLQSREALLQRVWGYEGNVNTRTVDTHVKRLRQKLGSAGALIETVHGFGYQLVKNPKPVKARQPGDEEFEN